MAFLTTKLLSKVLNVKSIGVGVVLALLVTLFVPIQIGNLIQNENKNEVRWYRQLEKIDSNLHRSIDTIFLGSSTIYNAIDVSQFDAITGRNTLKLALYGDFGTYGDFQLLKRWVSTSPMPPKTLIIWHAFNFWPRPLSQREIVLVNSNRLELLEFYWNRAIEDPLSRSTIHFPIQWGAATLKSFLQTYIPLFRGKNIVREALKTRMLFTATFDESLSEPVKLDAEGHKRYWREQTKGIEAYTFEPSYSNTFWLKKLIKLSEIHGIEILWSRAPLNKNGVDGVKTADALNRYNFALSNYLDSFQSTNLIELNKTQILYSDEMGKDLNHVNALGRQHVTNEIAHQFLDAVKLEKTN